VDVAGRTAVEVVLASLMHAIEVLGEMVEAGAMEVVPGVTVVVDVAL